ncbi:MAG: aldo/keto reductase [Candidatus Hydrogenedentota bacterium]
MGRIGRRGFLRTAASAALGASLGSVFTSQEGVSVLAQDAANNTLPTRRLGKIGYEATIFGLGAGGNTPIMDLEQRDTGVAIVNRALDLGVNYIDTAASYGGGASELIVGEVMRDRRDEVFLATKTRQRTAEGLVENEFEQSCERLQTDYIDLYHFHAVHTIEDLDAVLDRDSGPVTVFEQLREEGRIGNIGISSHSSATLMEAMDRYDFDCVFVTVNPAGLNMNGPDNLRDMLAMAQEKDIATVAMKIPARGGVLDRGITMEESLGYALSLPIATAVIGISSVDILEENVELAKAFTPFDDEKLTELEERARS